MVSKILMLRFPATAIQKPVVCDLGKEFDLSFIILHARIFPRKEGLMVLELSGEKKNYDEGIRYIKSQGISVQSAEQELTRNEDTCTHCGACTAVCPTGALSVKRPEMLVEFNKNKCSVCQLCVVTCPTRSMGFQSFDESFFDES